jgi:hypothetical protein
VPTSDAVWFRARNPNFARDWRGLPMCSEVDRSGAGGELRAEQVRNRPRAERTTTERNSKQETQLFPGPPNVFRLLPLPQAGGMYRKT